MKHFKYIIGFFCVFVLSGCGNNWSGFVYPDQDNLLIHKDIGKFSTLEQCREKALNTLEDMNALEQGDYECGYKCKPMSGGLNVCKKTEQ